MKHDFFLYLKKIWIREKWYICLTSDNSESGKKSMGDGFIYEDMQL